MTCYGLFASVEPSSVKGEEEVIYVSSAEDTDGENKEDPWWEKSLGLTESCHKIIKSGDWLSTDIMDASNKIVRENFPDIKGLQSTFRAVSKHRFTPQTQGSIQLHHSQEARHWVTSCYLDGEVMVYDSLPPTAKKFPADIEEQLRALYTAAASDGELAVTVPRVQHQIGGSDCGLFAVAYIFHLALGDRPEELIFDQVKMRDHLITCFELQTLLPFPCMPKRSRTIKHIIKIKV